MTVHIENICPDFFAFWEQAQGRDRVEQKELWRTLYEDRHRAVFDVYYSLYGSPSQLDAALDRFGHAAPRMQAMMPVVEQSIGRIAPQCQQLFAVPHSDPRYLIMIGLFCSHAWATPLRGQPTSFLALEHVHDSRHLDITIAHEAGHSLHRHCTSFTGDATTRTVGQTLFTEGLAVLTSTIVAPGATDAAYLHAIDDTWVAACERQWDVLRRGLLRDQERLAWVKPTPYFLADETVLGEDVTVVCGGYFVGYRAVRSLNRQYTIAEMARWPLERAVTEVCNVLEQMTEYQGDPS